MGLLSKVASVAGAVKDKVGSAIGALKSAAVVSRTATATKALGVLPVAKAASLSAAVLSTPAGRYVATQTNPVVSLATAAARARKGIEGLSSYQQTINARKASAAATPTPTPSTKSNGIVASVVNYVKENPVKSAVAAATVVGVGALAVKALTKKKTTKRKKKSTTKRRKSSRRSRKSKKKKYGTSRQYKRKGGKTVYYTKNGQPYIKLASGKARFVRK